MVFGPLLIKIDTIPSFFNQIVLTQIDTILSLFNQIGRNLFHCNVNFNVLPVYQFFYSKNLYKHVHALFQSLLNFTKIIHKLQALEWIVTDLSSARAPLSSLFHKIHFSNLGRRR